MLDTPKFSARQGLNGTALAETHGVGAGGRPPPVDLLAEALNRLRPRLADAALTPRQRLQFLWAGAAAANRFAARDVWGDAFARLIVETGLLHRLNRRTSAQDLCHLLAWAWMGRNPW